MASQKGSYYYHGDLWAEIFKRLPIKSICRFRSVCKSWNSLISSAFFILLHLAFTRSAIPRNLKPYLHVSKRRFVYNKHYGFDDFSRNCYALCHPSSQPLHFPFRDVREDGIKTFAFVDVIHGVVCVSYSWFRSNNESRWHPKFNTTLVWNPTIRKYIALPCLKLPRVGTVIGFGYDAGRDDFKIVMIWSSTRTDYQLYSAREGLWRARTAATDGIDFKSWLRFTPRRSVFVNGTIHWILAFPKPAYGHIQYQNWRFFVLMFDCEREEFRRSEIPKRVYSSEDLIGSIELLEYAGMLAGLMEFGMPWRGHLELWAMEEHGVSTSWKKLYIFTMTVGIIRCDPSFENMSPYGPNNPWNKYRRSRFSFTEDSDRVYEETMFLMDHPKAQSYADNEIVPISFDDSI